MKFRKSASENQSNRNLPSVLIQTLQSLEVESLILLPGEEVIFQSAGLSNFGLMKDERISSEELLALIRVVRRTKGSSYEIIDKNGNELPRIKLSNGKETLPGKKQIHRISNNEFSIINKK